ncbi:MAG: hypothetical protein VB021_00180 [Oscillospiraceae bacterium]|nr:hypothetical protein [Oscillospiraceae bacterium]
MEQNFERFDMKKPPKRQSRLLQPLVWALSLPDVRRHKAVITRTDCEGLEPPYILLGNHNAFFDFKVATKAIFPHRANYVIAIDGFIGREGLLRSVGGVCKRKFTSDVRLVRNIREVLRNGDILILYPEARYSLCGTTAVLPDSLGKMCRMMGVPVVTLICHGHHIDSPFWNLRKRGVTGTTAQMKQLFTAEQLRAATDEQVNEAIRREFVYDEFAWQKQNRVVVDVPWRAEGLHKVLYRCPACGAEYRMGSEGAELFCGACGKRWRMTELGELQALVGATEFSHIPDWYEWERGEVRREVEAGTYRFEGACHVDSLPNARRFLHFGEGTLIHDMDGFRVRGSGAYGDFSMERTAASLYSCHIEYEYLGKYGDCVDLNTLEDTFYIYPHGADFSVTKMALATEELYAFWQHKRKSAAAKGEKDAARGSADD